MMQSRVLRGGASALLLLISVTVAFGVLEFAVRLILPTYDPSGRVRFGRLSDGTPIGLADRVLRQVKNTGDYDVEVRFNSWGFRDDKPLTSAVRDDLFVVGDSFAFVWGVDIRDRFSNRLQMLLNQPVFNIAIAGADFDGYSGLIRYAQAEGAAVHRLIVCVTMENDLHIYGRSQPSAGSATPNTLTGAQSPTNIASLKAFLAEHSALFIIVSRAVHQTPWLRSIAVSSGLLVPNLEGIGDIMEGTDASLISSAARLFQLANGFDTVVLIVPSRRLWVGNRARREEAARLHTAFVDRLRSVGTTVVDMRDHFEQGGRPLTYHFPNDGHWNGEGHRLAAEALVKVLTQKSNAN